MLRLSGERRRGSIPRPSKPKASAVTTRPPRASPALSIGWLVGWSVSHTLLFYNDFIFWSHCSYPNGLVTSNMAHAHPHVTLVALYLALFSSIMHIWFQHMQIQKKNMQMSIQPYMLIKEGDMRCFNQFSIIQLLKILSNKQKIWQWLRTNAW